MRTVLLISFTGLISLSGIIFAVAEGSPLAGLSLLIALATLFLIDIEEIFAVPPFIANILGFVAFLFAGTEFFNGEIESRLLAGGHLIVYLTWVFMIQRKDVRHFWWLAALSVLQVATASVLTKSIWFGCALLLYVFVATWTLSVFLLYRSTLAAGELTGSEDEAEIQARFVVGDGWKGVSRDVDHRLLNWRFLWITGTMTLLGLMLSFLFFLFTPRIWIGQFSFFSDEAMSGRALTGFTEEVRLGDMGEILESAEVVLELSLSHTRTDVPFTQQETLALLGADPLFRGTVMESYENGRWRQISGEVFQRFSRTGQVGEITQRYKVAPIGSPALFTFGDVAFAASVDRGRRVLREQFSDEIQRDHEALLDRPFEYVVRSTTNTFDTTFAEQRKTWSRYSLFEFLGVYQRPLLMFPNRLERVRELALSLVQKETTGIEKGDRLEKYFTANPEFSYTLDLSISDASIDPIEDFLFNRKAGHCEYYASSMAIMLRAVGIPARLVSGFKGGEYDPGSQRYRVQQLHAHSWVEAYIDGQWRVYDPTPAGRSESVALQKSSYSSFERVKQTMNLYWSVGIEMSKRQQQEMIYQPIQKLGQESWNTAKNLIRGRSLSLNGLFDFLKSPEKWFSLQGGVLAFVLMLFITAMVWVFIFIGKLLQKFNIERSQSSQRGSQVEFYERFLKILNRHGIRQTPAQTAREFVQSSLVEITPKLVQFGFSEWPEELVSKFYEQRFGGRNLSAEEARDMQRRLTEFEACLAKQEETNS